MIAAVCQDWGEPELKVPPTVTRPDGARNATSSLAAAEVRLMVLEPERTATSRPAVRVVAETLAEAALASRPTSWLALTSARFRAAPPLSEPRATTLALEPIWAA